MARSLKKGPYVNERLLEKLRKLKAGDKTIVKTWDRGSEISPEMVGYTLGVHNGKTHLPVFVTEEMVGHRLGEFSATRKFVRHGGKMQKDIEKKGEAPAGGAGAPAASVGSVRTAPKAVSGKK